MIVLKGLGSERLITQGYGLTVAELLGVVSLSIDSILRTSKAAGVNLDAYLIQALLTEREVSIDAVFRRVGIQTSTSIDAILKGQDLSKYVTLSAVLRKEDITVSLDLDALLIYVKALSVGVESVLRKEITRGVGIEGILRGTLTRDVIVDAVLFAMAHPNKVFDYDAITTMSLDPIDKEFETEATTTFSKWISRTFERKR